MSEFRGNETERDDTNEKDSKVSGKLCDWHEAVCIVAERGLLKTPEVDCRLPSQGICFGVFHPFDT